MKLSVSLTQEVINAGFSDAVLNGTKEDVAFYVDFVSNPNIPDIRYGRLPIWVAMEGEDAYEKTKIVLSLNPDINIKNKNGQTPAMVALEKRMQGIGVLFLRHLNLDTTATDVHGNDLMKYAVLSRSPKAVIEAAKRGIAPDKTDADGHMPAYYAVKNNDMDVFRALCAVGLKRDKNNPAYREVIREAAQQAKAAGSLDWMRAVYRGVFSDVTMYVLSQDKETLLNRVKRLSVPNRFRVGKMLGMDFDRLSLLSSSVLEHPVEQVLGEALIERCRYGSPTDVALLLSVGANPNIRDKMGRTPLFCATAYHGRPEDKQSSSQIAESAYRKVKVLLESGANPNLPNLIFDGKKRVADKTPLEQSFFENRIGISVLLIKNGADVKHPDVQEHLVKVAAIYSKSAALDVLARVGVNLARPDKEGVIPLEHAILNNNPYNVLMLRKHLMAQGHEDLFDETTPQGKKVYQMALEKGPLMCDALTGTLVDPSQPEQKSQATQLTFEEKIAVLPPQKQFLLATLSGVDLTFDKTSEGASDNTAGVGKALNRHTPFRQALAMFKRAQRKKR